MLIDVIPFSLGVEKENEEYEIVVPKNTTIQTNVGCTIEYNMNSMVDNINVVGSEYVRADGAKPYQKLFPASSVVKPFRPLGAGVKYGIFGDVTLNTCSMCQGQGSMF